MRGQASSWSAQLSGRTSDEIGHEDDAALSLIDRDTFSRAPRSASTLLRLHCPYLLPAPSVANPSPSVSACALLALASSIHLSTFQCHLCFTITSLASKATVAPTEEGEGDVEQRPCSAAANGGSRVVWHRLAKVIAGAHRLTTHPHFLSSSPFLRHRNHLLFLAFELSTSLLEPCHVGDVISENIGLAAARV